MPYSLLRRSAWYVITRERKLSKAMLDSRRMAYVRSSRSIFSYWSVRTLFPSVQIQISCTCRISRWICTVIMPGSESLSALE